MELKVLVVEDKKTLNQNITLMLKKEGFIPFSAFDIISAKDQFLKENPDVVLLDIMLPGGKGYNLIPYFRDSSDVRIIMITALSDEKSKEIAFKLKAIKRRIISSTKKYRIGDITFDIETGELNCKGQSTTLTRNQINSLKLLYIEYEKNSFLDKAEIFDTNIDQSGKPLSILIDRLNYPHEIYINDILISQNLNQESDTYDTRHAYKVIEFKEDTTLNIVGKGSFHTKLFIANSDVMLEYIEIRMFFYISILILLVLFMFVSAFFYINDKSANYFLVLIVLGVASIVKAIYMGEIYFIAKIFKMSSSSIVIINQILLITCGFLPIFNFKIEEKEYERVFLLRGISHDLKLPLFVIKSSYEIIDNYDITDNEKK